MGLLLMHDFIIPHLGHVGNIDSLRYADLPNAETFHSSLLKKKITFVTIATNPTRKIFKYWEATQLTMVDMLPKIPFFV